MTKILGQDENKKILLSAIDENLPVLLIGETGTGKTSIVRELAQKQKQKVIRINLTGQTSTDDFLGKWLIKDKKTYWQDGILIQAMKTGRWLILDEINAALPEILFALHSLLDDDKAVSLAEKDGETVKPHKNFRFFATMNPAEEYTGTKDLNKAFLSRFPVVLQFDYPTPSIEVKILESRTKISQDDAKAIVAVAQELRLLKHNEQILYTCSTRDLIYWAEMAQLLGLAQAYEVTIVNKGNGDQDLLKRTYNNHIADIFRQSKDFTDKPNLFAELKTQYDEKLKELETAKDKADKAIETLNSKKDQIIKEFLSDKIDKEISKEND